VFTYGGAAGDVDADGDLDLYLTTWSGAQNKLYINDGLQVTLPPMIFQVI
jgi:hypothetical protein